MRLLLGILLVIGANALPAAADDAVDFATASPREVGLNAMKLREMSQWVRGEELDVRAMLIVRHGRLAFEWYSADVTRQHNHNVFSVTKSVVGTLAGIAIEQDRLPGVETPLGKLLANDHWSPDNRDKRKITLSQLLTMQGGLPVTRGNQSPGSPQRDLFDRVHRAKDRTRFLLSLPLAGEPGQRFAYNNNDPQLVAAIVEEAYDADTLTVGRRLLFDRLQFSNVAWQFPDAAGSYPGGYGLRLRAVDMAKVGQLYLNEGRWGDEHIFSAKWGQAATADQTGGGYGYYWWTEKGSDGTRPFAAKGVRGQRIYVDPEHDLVFVLAADLPPSEVQPVTKTLVERFVQPAILDQNIEAEDSAAAALLQEELEIAANYRPASRRGKPTARLPQLPAAN